MHFLDINVLNGIICNAMKIHSHPGHKLTDVSTNTNLFHGIHGDIELGC